MSQTWLACRSCTHLRSVEGPQVEPSPCPACGRLDWVPVVAPDQPRWHYVRDQQAQGPLSWRQLQSLTAAGQLRQSHHRPGGSCRVECGPDDCHRARATAARGGGGDV